MRHTNNFEIPISEWADMMFDTVTIAPWTGISVSGVPIDGAPVTYPAYIEIKNHMVVNHLGAEVMARGSVYIGSAVVCSVKDKLTLPVRYVPVSPPIVAVVISNDDFGVHHIVLEIG